MVARDRKLTEPLETIVWVLGSLLVCGMLAVAVSGIVGGGASVGGFGTIDICVTQPQTVYFAQPPQEPPPSAFPTLRPNAQATLNSALSVCALKPRLSQRVLYTLVDLPGLLVWVGVIVVLGRLLAAARRDGPFTRQVASWMRMLGWFVIVGAVLAAVIRGYATDALLHTMLAGQISYGDMFPRYGAIFPWVVVGAALLTFARFIKVGVAMEDDLKGTV